ncbi:hypothetical protein Aph02nite_92260 [Actinoplanes philippinensis]|uniref:Uncharacterized protein n=1 Tax=Actinoplanes philippinensis TaxID=35752 RepID=A0A1I2MT37_9ACTN|nr:hypothetical protein [Actinoplanes philippinensis]GIE83276.1 hypothetical protein Aph02nite_92260 [Actinoplanes philippinensis]SFF94583.1 hypothetical protein SAMN05421541_13349 [Actinoplanes philippinensis]
MTSTSLPFRIEQTRRLLRLQPVLNMVGILFLILMVVNSGPASTPGDGVAVYTVLGGLLLGGLLSAVAAKGFAGGRASAWFLALLAQPLVMVAVWGGWRLDLTLRVGILLTLVLAGRITANLLRAQVRDYFF